MQIFEVMCNNCQVVGTVPRVTILICILTYIIIHGILFKRVRVRLFLLNLLVF
jgi:hypothetical protein